MTISNDRHLPSILIIADLCFGIVKSQDKTMAVAVEPAQEVTTMKKPPTKQRRVVVTGLGVVTPLGHEPDVFYNNLLDGVSGISEIETFDCAEFPTASYI